MRSWVLNESPGEFVWGDVPTPEPGPDDVRVRVVASALNHIDHWQTTGMPKPRVMPHVPGSDGAGIVDAVGADVVGWAVGDEVVMSTATTSAEAVEQLGIDCVLDPSLQLIGEHRWGYHGEFIVVPGRNLLPRPQNRTWAECAAYPCASATAWRMLRRARLEPGMTVLVTGIGGGVATAALILARHLGAHVVTTSRDEAKRAASVRLGAADSFDSAGPYDVRADIVIDSIGPATFDQCLRALKPGGRFVTCGGTSGQAIQVSVPKLFFKQHELIGSTLGSYEEFRFVTDLVADGLPVIIDDVVPLAAFPSALERIRCGAQLGKIVLDHGVEP